MSSHFYLKIHLEWTARLCDRDMFNSLNNVELFSKVVVSLNTPNGNPQYEGPGLLT